MSPTDQLSTRVSIALLGVRSEAPVRRNGGAGPSDDGHFVIGGAGAAIPLNPDCPYVGRQGRLTLDGADLGL